MGVCASGLSVEEKEQLKRSREIEKQQRDARKEDEQRIKLLLLGAGESGKSTIFKQMKILYGANKGYTEEERKSFTPVVYNNAITSMKTLVENAHTLEHEMAEKDKAAAFLLVSDEHVIDQDTGVLIQALWADTGIQETFQGRAKFQLNDSAEYYFNRIESIMNADYIPTQDDVLRTRVRTSGIVEEKYIIDEVTFVMYDVGGQRNERKKWIHCFDNVTAVIFVAAVSEYDQVLYEDNTQNRMEEALNLFEEICNSRWFTETSMILFLNKCDLFEKKFYEVPMNDFFPDYAGGIDITKGYEYILNKFLSKNQSQEQKKIYHHITCATNTDNVRAVFNACKDIILKNNLKGSGFMDS